MTHCLKRTSEKGLDFVGLCILCGKENLTSHGIFEECENPNNVTDDEAVMMAIDGDEE